MIMVFRLSVTCLFIIIASVDPLFSQNLLNGPEDIIFDNPGNRILVSNWVSGTIVQIDSNGIQSYYKTGLSHAHGMELMGDTLYVASDSRIVALRLADAQTLFQINIPGGSRLGHITIDDSLQLYATDWNVHKIFRVDIPSQTCSTIVETGIDTPVGIMLQREFNRLILCQFLDNMPPHAVSLSDYSLTPLGIQNYDRLDAVVRDQGGHFYLSIWSSGEIVRYNDEFSNQPEYISSGHNGPSGLGFNVSESILGVTNYNSNSISLIPVASTQTVDTHNRLSSTFHLYQNYPNPFNVSTVISWQMVVSSPVILTLYNLNGQRVAVLVNDTVPAGFRSVQFDASHLASGIYIYRIETKSSVDIRKMVLLK